MSASQLLVGTPATSNPANDNLTRTGVTPALVLGANVIACAGIRTGSEVTISINSMAAPLLAGAAPAPVVTIQNGVSFTVTALAAHQGSTYSYLVTG